jgi:hypothetical protein
MSEMIKRIADAIEGAEVGYSLRLTRFVDGISTYTLTYDDGTPPLEFESNSDAYEHIAAKKRAKAARLVLEAMREPTYEMAFADDVKEWPEDAKACWRAMIDVALADVSRSGSGE